MEPKENVACYVRVSTALQTKEDKYSIPEQIDILNNICKTSNWNPNFYDDLGISSESMNTRPGFLKMISACKEGVYKKVLVVDQDRITRNVGDLQRIKEIFTTRKINLVLQNDILDFNNEDDDFISDINGVLSKREIRIFAKRSARGKYQKAKQGKIPTSGFNINYGFKLNKDDQMVINEDEASTMRLIFELIVSGLSEYKVADKLNALGIPTRSKEFNKILKSRISGKIFEPIWTRSTINHLVHKDLYYKDEYVVCKKSKYDYIKPVTIKIEPIITLELFNKAQEQLSKNKSFHNNKAKAVYILTGKMRCLKCNSAYVGGTWNSNSGINYYYRDLGKRSRGHDAICNGASIKRDLIENLIKEDITNYLKNPDTIKKYLNTSTFTENNDIDKKIDAKVGEINRLLDLYSRADIPNEVKDSNLIDSIRKKQEEVNELKKLKAEVSHKQEISNMKEDKFDNLSKMLTEISYGISNLNEWEWKAIVNKLIDKIEIDSIPGLGKTNKLDIYITYNFDKILKNTCQWSDKVNCSPKRGFKTCNSGKCGIGNLYT